jgi:integrase
MAKITHDTVANLQPGQIEWDSEVKGFYVRCQREEKTYGLKDRFRGTQVWLKIGDVGTYTPKQARNQASAWKRDMRAGVHPDKLRASLKGEPTVNDLCDRYIREHVEPHNKPSTVATFKGIVERHIRPTLGKRTVGEVDTEHVAKLHQKLQGKPRTANQTVSVLSKMFNLAELWKLRPQNSNPCKHLVRYAETERDRHYEDAELQATGAALTELEAAGQIQPGAATAIRLLALTGCRLGEVAKLQWSDIDLAGAKLTIRDAKAGARKHSIGAATVAYLSTLTRGGPYVCQGGVPERGVSKRRVQEAWEVIRTKAGIANSRLHDLRHTVGTYAGDTGANAFLVRDALGHKTLAMTGRYVGKGDRLRQLVDQVADRVSSAMTGVAAVAATVAGEPKGTAS